MYTPMEIDLISLHFCLKETTKTMPPPGRDDNEKKRSTRSSSSDHKRSSRNPKITQKIKDNIEFEKNKRKDKLERAAHQRGVEQRRKRKKAKVTPTTPFSLSSSDRSNTTSPSPSPPPRLQVKEAPPPSRPKGSSSKTASPGDSIDIKSQSSSQQKCKEVVCLDSPKITNTTSTVVRKPIAALKRPSLVHKYLKKKVKDGESKPRVVLQIVSSSPSCATRFAGRSLLINKFRKNNEQAKAFDTDLDYNSTITNVEHFINKILNENMDHELVYHKQNNCKIFYCKSQMKKKYFTDIPDHLAYKKLAGLGAKEDWQEALRDYALFTNKKPAGVVEKNIDGEDSSTEQENNDGPPNSITINVDDCCEIENNINCFHLLVLCISKRMKKQKDILPSSPETNLYIFGQDITLNVNIIEPTIKKPKEGSQGYNYIHIGKVNTEVPVENKFSLKPQLFDKPLSVGFVQRQVKQFAYNLPIYQDKNKKTKIGSMSKLYIQMKRSQKAVIHLQSTKDLWTAAENLFKKNKKKKGSEKSVDIFLSLGTIHADDTPYTPNVVDEEEDEDEVALEYDEDLLFSQESNVKKLYSPSAEAVKRAQLQKRQELGDQTRKLNEIFKKSYNNPDSELFHALSLEHVKYLVKWASHQTSNHGPDNNLSFAEAFPCINDDNTTWPQLSDLPPAVFEPGNVEFAGAVVSTNTHIPNSYGSFPQLKKTTEQLLAENEKKKEERSIRLMETLGKTISESKREENSQRIQGGASSYITIRVTYSDFYIVLNRPITSTETMEELLFNVPENKKTLNLIQCAWWNNLSDQDQKDCYENELTEISFNWTYTRDPSFSVFEKISVDKFKGMTPKDFSNVLLSLSENERSKLNPIEIRFGLRENPRRVIQSARMPSIL